MINIANILLTRRCNLTCDYCRISSEIDYITMPRDYPISDYYFNHEQSPDCWIDSINRLGKHNPDVFFILYGGEPFMYEGLVDIVKHLNQSNFYYTIISNCTHVDKMRAFFEKINYVKGFTASIDPGFWKDPVNHEKFKSRQGLEFLQYVIRENLTEDPVAEITADSYNVSDLEETVKMLSAVGITSCINFIDIAKNNYYDFSNITNPICLVNKDDNTKNIIDRLIKSDYKIHMKETLLQKLYNILPSELDCGIDEELHNITIDSDGSMRLCLRIKGIDVPKIKLRELINEDGRIIDTVKLTYQQDKASLCKKCNWSCMMMSQLNQKNVIDHGD